MPDHLPLPVIEVPQVWSPWLIQNSAPELKAKFGYRPGSASWRLGVMDPNITVMKTSHMPMLACEAAFRARPSAFRAVYVANGIAHRDNPHFASFAGSLTAVRAGVMTVEPRFVGPEFLADHCDAVVTHQWENALNYVYYEALYGGYPLVHNSPMLEPLGYVYDAFDAESGGAALLHAFAVHDDKVSEYRAGAGAFLAGIDAEGTPMIAAYESHIQASR